MTGFSSDLGPKRVVESSVEPQWHATLENQRKERIIVTTVFMLFLAAFFGYLLYIRPEIDRGHWTQYFFWLIFLASLVTGCLGLRLIWINWSKN